MTEFLVNIELAVLNFLYGLHNPILNAIMVFTTRLGDGGIIWIALGLALCFTKKYKRAGVCMLLALIINLLICNLSLKPLVARIRPYEYADGIKLLIPEPHDYSFPSGHSSSSFAAALSLFFFNRKIGTVSLIAASAIAFSRLYLYVHFPTDVIFGILTGVFSAYLSKKLLSKSKLFVS